MASRVLAEAEIAIDERRVDGRELRRSEILLAKQPVHRSRTDSGEEASFGIDPGIVDWNRSVGVNGPGVVARRNTGRGAQSAISSCESTGIVSQRAVYFR